jgi:hypothetical protein
LPTEAAAASVVNTEGIYGSGEATYENEEEKEKAKKVIQKKLWNLEVIN